MGIPEVFILFTVRIKTEVLIKANAIIFGSEKNLS